jgi:FAD/FMN-containing dehydrogenase
MTTTETATRGFPGQLLQPGDVGYEQARRVWNGAIDRRPAFIARCTGTDDVAAAVRFGVRHDLPIAVRGGGHSIPGHSVCEGGLMIDLQPMKRVTVDPARRLAYAEPGVLHGEYDAATQAHGLASPGGEISHTGMAGLTLGGGVGWLSRMYGLACDNLLAAEVVTARGEVVLASSTTEPDLLWGLRGGGGNFGVVTRFTYRLHPLRPLLAGAVVHPLEAGRNALRLYRDLAAQAPDELSLVAACITAPPAPFVPPNLVGKPVVALAMAWVGDPVDGEPWAARLRSLRPAVDLLSVMPYVALQSMSDDAVPHGLHSFTKSEWLRQLDDAAIDSILAASATMSSPLSQVLLRQLGGAISRVSADATAFSYRDAAFMLTVPALWPAAAGDPTPHVAWARGLWSALGRVSCGGGYVNHMDRDDGANRLHAAYLPETWRRLIALKRRYDPVNVFHLNQNIPPSG